MTTLTCPQIESREWEEGAHVPTGVAYLCDRDATYQIEGTVYCQIHAKRIMLEKENRALKMLLKFENEVVQKFPDGTLGFKHNIPTSTSWHKQPIAEYMNNQK